MIQSTRLAKAVYSISGRLSKIKVPRRTYMLTDGGEVKSAERRKLPIRTASRLLRLSAKLDRYHWEHWALDHSSCEDARPCYQIKCSGFVCDYEE